MTKQKQYILWFNEISKKDVALVGGKNASLGEMFSQLNKKGIRVPDGFATTSNAYWYFLNTNKLLPKLKKIFRKLDTRNIGKLQEAGEQARILIAKAEFPDDLKEEILKAYRILSRKYKNKKSKRGCQKFGHCRRSADSFFCRPA